MFPGRLCHFSTGVLVRTYHDYIEVLAWTSYNCDSVFADILEPDKFQGARAIAVDTFRLILADNNVFQGCAAAKEEDGVGISTFGLLMTSAGSPVVLRPATVINLTGGNLDDLTIRHTFGRRWDTALVPQACESDWQANKKLHQARFY